MTRGIFISYRRDDTRQAAGRLAEDLGALVGEDAVFRDVESIEAGLDFKRALQQALSSCAVMLVLIGPRWLDIADAKGARRLDDPSDWIRQEIEQALARDIRVVPVLIDDAALPAADALPASLRALVDRQAVELSDRRWRSDLAELVVRLKRMPGLRVAWLRGGLRARWGGGRGAWWWGGGLAGLALAAGLVEWAGRGAGTSPAPMPDPAPPWQPQPQPQPPSPSPSPSPSRGDDLLTEADLRTLVSGAWGWCERPRADASCAAVTVGQPDGGRLHVLTAVAGGLKTVVQLPVRVDGQRLCGRNDASLLASAQLYRAAGDAADVRADAALPLDAALRAQLRAALAAQWPEGRERCFVYRVERRLPNGNIATVHAVETTGGQSTPQPDGLYSLFMVGRDPVRLRWD